ncbi:MAG TPA: hypothetical protein PK286_12000 [Devosia sp.]|nr:hypothetical protein [Devosia sp.]
MLSGRLLLVCPDPDLRLSLTGAMEREGLAVTVRDLPPSRSWLAANRFDCTIVDQRAFSGADYEAIAFCIKAHPVVLLAASPHAWLTEWVVKTLALPLKPGDVIAAVREAMFAEA